LRIKILCLTILFLAFSLLPSYAYNDIPLDQQTMDRLRETYNMEAPGSPFMLLSRWSEGDWGISLDPSSLPDLFQAALYPAWFLARQLVLTLSS
jgi:hypothetical protein